MSVTSGPHSYLSRLAGGEPATALEGFFVGTQFEPSGKDTFFSALRMNLAQQTYWPGSSP